MKQKPRLLKLPRKSYEECMEITKVVKNHNTTVRESERLLRRVAKVKKHITLELVRTISTSLVLILQVFVSLHILGIIH